MKNTRNSIFTLSLVLILFFSYGFQLNAQSQRITLVEQVTSASCGPCASQNPAFNSLLLQNKDNNVVVVKYQRGGGNYVDHMWNFNSYDTDQRIASYYGSFSFPQVWIDGQFIGLPNSVSQTTLGDAKAIPSSFDIEVTKQLNAANDSLFVTGSVTYIDDFEAPDDNHLRAFFVVIEKEVQYDQANPPGTNGELDFKWVMRKILPAFSGEIMGHGLSGTEHDFEYAYGIDLSEIDPNELEVIAFVQRYGTKEVMQAATTDVPTQPTAIQETMVDNEIQVYPTVAQSEVNVGLAESWNDKTQVKIFNTNGQLMKIKNAPAIQNGIFNFNTSKLAAGTYLVQVSDGVSQVSSKFIIQR